jgi:hypothetical protein
MVAVPRFAWPTAAAVVAAAIVVPIEYANTSSVLESAQALLAVVLALGVACLAFSLPGITPAGLVAGGFFVTAGAVSWTYGRGVWGPLLIGGLAFLVWSRPWSQPLQRFGQPMARLGSAWLGLTYWILGVVGAVLMGRPTIAVERLVYAGLFTLAVLAVIASTALAVEDSSRPRDARRAAADLSVGVTAAFLFMIAILLAVGAGNLFDPIHVVVAGPWGRSQTLRFWGGPELLYHPNSLAGIATFAAVRIGFDQRFAAWQRLAVTAMAGYVVYITNSRTGFLVLGTAAVTHAVLLWWSRRTPAWIPRWLTRRTLAGLPKYPARRIWLAGAVPFVVLALILVASGGRGFIVKQRYGEGGLSSGRTQTWAAVATEWRDAGTAEKLFGDTKTTRAVVRRAESGDVDLTTDNAAVGALRRGGLLGVAAFLFGLWLLVRHAGRREAPAWFLATVIAAIPTIAVADWLLGGTGGTLWILLVAGEVWLGYATSASRSAPDEESATDSG